MPRTAAPPRPPRPRRRCPAILAWIALAALAAPLAPSSAAAEPGAPRGDGKGGGAADLFRAARAAYARGEYRAAAAAFEAAHREAPHAATMYNAALAWEIAGDAPRAATAFALALAGPRGELSKEQEREAKARLERLGRALGRLDIEAPPGAVVSAGHVERAPAPLTVYVEPGEHRVSVVFEGGGESSRDARVAAGKEARIAFEASSRAAAPEEPREPPPEPPPPPAEAGSGGGGLRTAGWITLGGGVLLGGAVAILGASALSARDEFEASGRTDQDAHDRAATLRTWTNVTLVAAGVTAAAGITLLLIPDRQPARAELRLGPGALLVRGRF